MADDNSLKFATINVNGLSDPRKRARVFNTLELADYDVIFLQETHVASQSVADSYSKEWKGVSHWSYTPSIASKGVAILFKRGLTAVIETVIIDRQGRFCKITCNINNINFQLIAIYGPNQVKERLLFLDLVHKLIVPNLLTIIGGDFNFIEDWKLDRLGPNPKLSRSACIDNTSTASINKIKNDFNLIDVYRAANPTGKDVTFMYAKSIGKRLDRFYINQSCKPSIRHVNISNIANCDHLAVSFTLLTGNGKLRGKGYWKCNVKTLDDIHFQADLKRLYEDLKQQYDCSTAWWDQCKTNFKNLIITHSIRLASNRKKQLNKLNYLIAKYKKMEIYFPNKYTNLILNLKTEADALLDDKAEGDRIRARLIKLNSIDNPAALAKETEIYNNKKKYIDSLKRDDSVIITEQADIESECVRFYSNLLKSDNIQADKWQELTNNITKLNELERISAETPILYKECVLAIAAMHDKKSPGSDGLPPEFYKRFFHLFGKEFVEIFNSELDRLSDSQRIGVITLLCKDASKADTLSAWRPITLLNIDYKIISKVILNKLKPISKSIVSSSQTCGVKGRSIFDNLHFLRNVFDYCKARDLPCIALCFDQAKAFDRIEHRYLLHILERLGLGPNIIKLITLLYTDIYSSVLINGFLSDLFTVTRSMRQGCGLSPLLYAFCIEPLIFRIKSSLLFKGIPMPNSSEARIAVHADDSTVLASNVNSVEIALNYFDIYCKASGAKLNLDKSVAFVVNDFANLLGWPSWLSKVKTVKICGIHFGRDAETIDEESLINKISIKLQYFRNFLPSSLHTRVAFLNTFILTKVWYLANVKLISTVTINSINKLLFNFLWKKTEKVNRLTVCLPSESGGLGLANIKIKCQAMRIKHAIQAYMKLDTPWISYAKYWTNVSFNKFFPGVWNNNEPHTLEPSPFYKEVIEIYSEYRKSKPETLSLQNIMKVAYNHLIIKTIKPKACFLDDADMRAEAWKRLKKSILEPEARDTIWLVSHEALPVAFYLFRFHLLVHNLCVLCMRKVESIDHCLIECINAKALWTYIFTFNSELSDLKARDLLYLNLGESLDRDTFNYLTIIISTAVQTIWTARNDKVFNDKDISPTKIINKFNYRIKYRIKCDRIRLKADLFNSIWASRSFYKLTI